MVHSHCRGTNYRTCPVYSDGESSNPSTPSTHREPYGQTRSEPRQDGRAVTETTEPDKRKPDPSGPVGTDGKSNSETILSVIGLILLGIGNFLWKLLKTIPLWTPYAGIVLLLGMLTPVGAAGAVASPLGGLIALAVLLYPVLHTVLLLRCRKRTKRHKYRPVYIGFFLFVLTFPFTLGLPAVAFQIGWLIWENKQKRAQNANGTNRP